MAIEFITLPTGEKVACDFDGTNYYQVTKLAWGSDGAFNLVDNATPMPVSGPLTNAQLRAAAVDIAAASLPLPDGAATEASLQGLISAFAPAVVGVPDNLTPANPVRALGQDVWNCSFSEVGASVLSPQFNSPIVGAGVGYSQAAGALALTSGTTANSEFLARSAQSWRGSLRMRFSTVLSQRIANQNFAVILGDLVGEGLACTINSATSITVTKTGHGLTAQNVGQFMFVGGIAGANGVPGRYAIASVPTADTITFTVAGWPASGSCTLTLFGHSHVKTLFTGTTATAANWDCQRRGWATGDTALGINTTASPGTIMQTELDGRSCYVWDTLRATSQAPTFVARGSRYENIPDDNLDLYAFIWLYNGSTAPASTTTWTISFMAIEKFANTPVYVQGFRAQGAVNPIPVLPQNTTTPALVASTSLIGDVGFQNRANATGAASIHHFVAAATTNAANIKAAAGRVVGWHLVNTTASWRYVKLHNTAGAPTAGAGVVATIGIPPNGVASSSHPAGIGFATGIARTCVTGAADADATATAVGDVVGDIFFA